MQNSSDDSSSLYSTDKTGTAQLQFLPAAPFLYLSPNASLLKIFVNRKILLCCGGLCFRLCAFRRIITEVWKLNLHIVAIGIDRKCHIR